MARSNKLNRLAGSLTGRLALTTLLIHLFLVPPFFGGAIYILQQAYQSLFVNQVRSESHLFATLIAPDIHGDVGRVENSLEEALLGGRVVYADLVRTDGFRVTRGSGPQGGAALPEDFFFGQHEDGVYYVSLPLTDGSDQPLATLTLGYDESVTRAQIVLAYQRGILIVLAYVLLSLSLAGLTSWTLTSPLKKLGLQSRRIASGDFVSELEVGSKILEINELADDLNNMRRELVQQANRLEHQAMHDALTALPNRVLLRDRVEAAIKKARRDKTQFSLMLMDLDHFKEVNDTLGHPIGDMVLQLTAAKLKQRLRECDTVSRLGGDEFAVLIFTEDVEAAKHVAQKVRDTLERPLRIDELTLHVGGSIGISMYPEDGADFETLLRRADVAMYTAKREGTGYALYQKSRDPNSAKLLSLMGELRDAIDADALTLYYQPKFSLADRSIVGAEALVRWPHPERGMVMPNDFIPLAEKSGLIEPLTNWVLKTAMRQTQLWEEKGINVPLAVNISAKNLQIPSFPDTLAALFKQSNIKRQNFVLELTESALLVDPNQAIKVLEQFDKVGVRLSIDDFGTGYSSLSYLKRLPVRELKIDRVFIKDMVTSRNDLAIVTATIQMAHGLDLSVVAEGIEDEATLNKLAELGCDVGQGYFFSTPLDSARFAKFWLASRRAAATREGADIS